jgi:hypothetical protein
MSNSSAATSDRTLAPARKYLPAAAIAAVVLALSLLWTPETLPNADLCFVRRVLGVPCPTCGMTRAFCAISHGRFVEATRFNPLCWLFYPGAAALVVLPFVARPSGRYARGEGAGWYVGVGIVLAVLLYGFWALRLMGLAV